MVVLHSLLSLISYSLVSIVIFIRELIRLFRFLGVGLGRDFRLPMDELGDLTLWVGFWDRVIGILR